jgi:hypothetical protein
VQVGCDIGKLSIDLIPILVSGVTARQERRTHLSTVDGSTEDTRERLHGLLVASLHDQPTRTLGQDSESGGEDGSPNDLESDGDTVAVGVVDELGSVDDNSSDE